MNGVLLASWRTRAFCEEGVEDHCKVHRSIRGTHPPRFTDWTLSFVPAGFIHFLSTIEELSPVIVCCWFEPFVSCDDGGSRP